VTGLGVGGRLAGLRRAAAAFGLVLRESIRMFARHHGLEAAATLAFFGFLSLIPLAVMVIFVLSQFVLSSQAALEAVESVSRELSPAFGPALLKEIRTVASQGAWSALSAVVLFGSILPFASVARAAFRRIVAPAPPARFLASRLMDFAGGLLLLALFVLVVAGKLVYATLSRRVLVNLSVRADLLNLGVSFGTAVFGLWLFYLVFMPGRTRASHVAAGALTAAVLLFLLRPAFAAFLRYNPSYGFAFGSLKAVFLLATWFHLSCAAILLGGEVIAVARRRDAVLLGAFLDGARGPRRASRWLVSPYLRTFGAGATIFRDGDPAPELFYVQTGRVRLRRANVELQQVGPGEFFGEMATLGEGRRTAAAEAMEEGTELVAIPGEHARTILQEDPRVAQNLLRVLVGRLARADEQIERLGRGGVSNPPPGGEGEQGGGRASSSSPRAASREGSASA
jgi:YihY family inner membrane protein